MTFINPQDITFDEKGFAYCPECGNGCVTNLALGYRPYDTREECELWERVHFYCVCGATTIPIVAAVGEVFGKVEE